VPLCCVPLPLPRPLALGVPRIPGPAHPPAPLPSPGGPRGLRSVSLFLLSFTLLVSPPLLLRASLPFVLRLFPILPCVPPWAP